jgi:hypothetical protein
MADRYWVSQNVTKQFNLSAQDGAPVGLFFKPDGTKLYIIGQGNDSVFEYDLSTAWDVSTASYLQARSIAAQESVPTGLFFKPDGTKMYVIGSNGDDINEYDLSTAWNISTATYLQNYSVAIEDTSPQEVFFKPDGTKMYVLGSTGDDVNEYDLSTAWDVSTASYLQVRSVLAQDSAPTGLFFKPDGTKMYVLGSAGDDVNEYDLSTAWDISTATYLQNYSTVAEDSNPQGLFFKPDGTVMYITGANSDFVVSYPLSTPWDISSITIDRWDSSAGNKWATTSGGTGGASVPTSADDVYFDSNSGNGTVEIAAGNTGAKSITCTGFTGGVYGTANITISGSITLASTMGFFYTGQITINGTGSITSAGKTFTASTIALIIDGTGITVDLADAFSATGSFRVLGGTFNTNNYSLTAGNLNCSGSNTRAVNLGSSTVSLTGAGGVIFTNQTNLTFNAGTSQINIAQGAPIDCGSGVTFYNVTFTSLSVGTSNTINGNNIFNNLTLSPITVVSTGLKSLVFSNDQTINGTLTCAGRTGVQRSFIRSNTLGTPVTITANAISADDCDFRDIILSGAASGSSPTRAGDCGGNSNITFPAPKNVYRVSTQTSWEGTNVFSGNNASNSGWALTSGGARSTTAFPLPQDTAIINNSTGSSTISIGTNFNISSIDCSPRTTTGVTLNFNASQNFHGNLTLSSSVAITGTNRAFFVGRGTQTITSNGVTITFPITVDTITGTVQFADALTMSVGGSSALSLNSGTLDASSSVTVTSFQSSTSTTRTLNMGSGLWTIGGSGTCWGCNPDTNLTINKGTADILLSNDSTTARTFDGGAQSYNKITIGGNTSISTTSFGQNSTYAELASTKTVAHTVRFGPLASRTINTWSITGTPGNVVSVISVTAGSRASFTLTNPTSGIDYLAVKDIGVSDPNRFYVGANSTDNGNNLNVYFTASPVDEASNSNFFLLFA